MRLKDKVIIVTGSTMGIGKAIATRVVAEGAKVIIHGLEKDLGIQVVSELGAEKARLHLEDLSNEGAPQRLVDLSIKSWGRLDAIVNNAAIVAASDIHSTDKAFLNRLLEVNTFAPLFLIQSALPHLIESHGTVLNIGSINAWSGEHNLLAYSITKGALMTMTRNLGDSLFRENGVRVNQINPGWVLTEKEIERKREHGLADSWYKNLSKLYAPSGRIIWPEEIALATIYWLSDESGPISGQVIDLEQFPMIGRNIPKDSSTVPHK
ncbi:SDR family oxidoreductase [Algoriphagus sp. AGSA1]|uniref:SDR family oxidoreductase n=1 Tax=Algoriphagus sp. AGSA1 TaxID=2907213 RepID=UPI001F473F5A|nr:SDR family oxidoreductase [Algoriphagus sp. AGSA1]MCE7056822.1 SDR family oxidoreductase [Algoriphagus sp. AGSA1]